MAEDKFDRVELFAGRIVKWATASHVLVLIIVVLMGWIIFGPLFGFSAEWQSVMVIPITVITFLLVFLILRAQNKDTRAIQLKLNEIIAALNGANNELIDIENKSEQAIEEIHQRYEVVAEHLKNDVEGTVTDAISVLEIAEEIILAKEIESELTSLTESSEHKTPHVT